MSTISIEVDSESARAFAQASDEDRRKLELLLRLRLRELTFAPARTLTQVMDQISREAEERGLTPEILKALLNG